MPRGESLSVVPSVAAATVADVWALLEAVCDPEIPVVSLRELGVLRAVTPLSTGADPAVDTPPAFDITITPTYSGCPAMGQMEDDLIAALQAAGIRARVTTVLAPAWTTDWMTDSARAKLLAYGIAPPGPVHAAHHAYPVHTGQNIVQFTAKKVAKNPYTVCREGGVDSINHAPIVRCPRCASDNTTETSHFGSTACKALYKCLDCWEPFDYFKPL